MKYICDTCVLIDFLKGKENIKNTLKNDMADGLAMSTVTYMELMVGAFNKREISLIKKAFSDFEILEITENISIKARMLIEQWTKSHGLLIPDAIIAATALEFGLPLYTSNISDFKYIPNIKLK